MSKIRYINAYECKSCFSTFETQCQAQMCCEDECVKLEGYECKSCVKIYDTVDEARFCCPDPKPMSYSEFGIDAEDPVDEDDAYDEILIGGITITDTLEPIEVIDE